MKTLTTNGKSYLGRSQTSKFTEGPWVNEKGYIKNTEGVTVCLVHKETSYGIDCPKQQANARLIAAAPEMFELLDCLVPMSMSAEDTAHLERMLIRKARKLLDKIEGGEECSEPS